MRSLASFLHSIRRAYLDLGASSSASNPLLAHRDQPPPRQLDLSKGLQAWEGVRWLSDRERDEIDFAVKVAIRKSVDRVRELEALEKGARTLPSVHLAQADHRGPQPASTPRSARTQMLASLAS